MAENFLNEVASSKRSFKVNKSVIDHITPMYRCPGTYTLWSEGIYEKRELEYRILLAVYFKIQTK